MEPALSDFFKVLRYLNEAENLSSSYKNLCLRNSFSEDYLNRMVSMVNSVDPILCSEKGSLKLIHSLDLLDQPFIYKESLGKGRVEIAEVIDSTNSEFLRRIDNLVSGDVLLAEIQTAGRGRRNTDWYSPIGCQLILSLCHCFKDLMFSQGLSVATGVTVARYIESLGIKGIEVKWPNDLYLNDHKVGGILIESSRVTRGYMTIIGLGLNVHRPTKHRDAFNWLEKNDGITLSRSRIAAELISVLRSMCEKFSCSGLASFSDDFARYDRLRGHEIIIENESGRFKGTASGVDSSGRLIVLNKGFSSAFSSGHIRSY